jgi:ABC-2 type transport system ATP-binding protein
MSAIATDGLTKYYGDVRGVEDLDLEVSEGEVFGFLGPNGAGKTTTIRTIMGFLAPTAGEARLLGRDVTEERELRAAKARVGYLPSDPGLDERVTSAAGSCWSGSTRRWTGRSASTRGATARCWLSCWPRCTGRSCW